MEGFRALFGSVSDPRDYNVRHDLTEILFIALAATLCGAQDCSDFSDFGHAKEEWLRQYMELPHGVPSHDTFSRVLRVLVPEELQQALERFNACLATVLREKGTDVEVIAFDGKTLRRAYEAGQSSMPPMTVSAFDTQTRMTLAHAPAPGGAEIEAVLRLVDLLDLSGAVVTADALHSTRRMVKAVREKGADYALVLKGNRGPLYKEAVERLAATTDAPEAETRERGHGRVEHRRAWVVPAADLETRHKFAGLAAIGCIKSQRQVGDKTHTGCRVFVLSRQFTPEALLRIARDHWAIENCLHWQLDVVFGEDQARNRKDHAPENLALIRRIALNILRAHPRKASMKSKRNTAGWNNDFFNSLFAHMR